MGLKEEIFPRTRNAEYVQTQWAKGWTYGAIGFQEAARFLTEHRRDFGATIDQTGLAIFFLQRHRVELAIKEVLVADGQNPRGHSLAELWKKCRTAVGSKSSDWRELDKEGSELVALLHGCDPDGTRFRYATDLDGKAQVRPAYIDLDALEKHVNGFVALLQGYLTQEEEGALAADYQ
jgi:HEPN domain-containing protein